MSDELKDIQCVALTRKNKRCRNRAIYCSDNMCVQHYDMNVVNLTCKYDDPYFRCSGDNCTEKFFLEDDLMKLDDGNLICEKCYSKITKDISHSSWENLIPFNFVSGYANILENNLAELQIIFKKYKLMMNDKN